jgi:uncharacterized protein YdhG (YjbR/CyaY superfamily)
MKAKTISEYVAAVPAEGKKHFEELRSLLKKVAPKAEEKIKWGYPALEDGRILFSYSAFKTYVNFMPTRTTLHPFLKDLKEYKVGKDTIQFPYDKPLPKALITKIAKYRIKEVKEGSLWMHNDKEKKMEARKSVKK